MTIKGGRCISAGFNKMFPLEWLSKWAGKSSGAMEEKAGQHIPVWVGLGSDPWWHWWQVPMSMGYQGALWIIGGHAAGLGPADTVGRRQARGCETSCFSKRWCVPVTEDVGSGAQRPGLKCRFANTCLCDLSKSLCPYGLLYPHL